MMTNQDWMMLSNYVTLIAVLIAAVIGGVILLYRTWRDMDVLMKKMDENTAYPKERRHGRTKGDHTDSTQ